MKYTTSYNVRYRPGIGEAPKPWIETDLTDHEKVMGKYHRDELYTYDADTCDNGDVFFVFDDGKAFKMEWSYWMDYDPEWEIHNEWHSEEIDITDTPLWMHKERDWLLI